MFSQKTPFWTFNRVLNTPPSWNKFNQVNLKQN